MCHCCCAWLLLACLASRAAASRDTGGWRYARHGRALAGAAAAGTAAAQAAGDATVTAAAVTVQKPTGRPYDIGNPAGMKHLWVDPVKGSDSRSGGSRSQALRTLAAAWLRIPASRALTAGYHIHILRGTLPPSASEPCACFFVCVLVHGCALRMLRTCPLSYPSLPHTPPALYCLPACRHSLHSHSGPPSHTPTPCPAVYHYWESRWGSREAPIIIEAVEGRGSVVLQAPVNVFDVRWA